MEDSLARQSERSAATREAIIEAAEGLFGRLGVDATTVDQIAAASNVAKGAVYHHFASKTDIFEKVFERVSARIAEDIGGTNDFAGDNLAILRAGTRRFFDLCAEPSIRRVLLEDAPKTLGYARWRELDARHFGGMVASGLAWAMERGSIAPQPLEPLANTMLGAIQTAALHCAQEPDFSGASERYLAVLNSMLRGLAR